MGRQSVIIIGGGITGLVAARQLAENFDVTLLEALPRFGGRIRTITDERSGALIEGGAEFVHGDARHSLALLAEAGLELKKVSGEFYHKKGTGLVAEVEDEEEWHELMCKMAEISEDMTLQDFLDRFFQGAQWMALRKRVVTFAGGFDLADKDRVSVKSLYREWSHQGEDHRITGGYGKLIDFLVSECRALGCNLLTDTEVRCVEWPSDGVKVITHSRQEYPADKCVVTLPLGVLHKRNVLFNPSVGPYLKAAGQIGFGTVVKVVLVFRERLWKEDTGFIFSEEVIPTWWTQHPASVPVLTGWAGGPKGALLEGYSDQKLVDKAVASIAAIFELTVKEIYAELLSSYVFNWKKVSTALGAYSYATPESAAAVVQLSSPANDILYFAGEACYTGVNPGTVEAAVSSALEVSKTINCTLATSG